MAIFMIGTQRSGSNLLRLMLNQQAAIAAPHPPHILERFIPLLPHYGDLEAESNFELLIDDICRMIEINPVSWEGVCLERSIVKAACGEPTLMAIYGAVYDLMSEAKDALVWCCKSLANVHFLAQIDEFFPDARYLYLYRDGRDVALSFRRAVVGDKSYYHLAKHWHVEQQLAFNLREKIAERDYFALSYEELVTLPERTLKKMMHHFKIPFDKAMLNFNESVDAIATAKSGSLWANVQQPVIKGNTRKFLKEASRENIRIFELVAGESLDMLGYDRAYTEKGEVFEFSEAEIRTFEEENERLKRELAAKLDPDELRLRQPQQKLLKEIVNRVR